MKELGVLLSDGNESESGVNTGTCDEDGSGAEGGGEIGKLERMVKKREGGGDSTGPSTGSSKKRSWSPSALDPGLSIGHSVMICLI